MILVVVCHPDDESLWFGGSLHALSKFVDINVICLSGCDANYPREMEFHAAQKIAGYQQGVVLGYPLRTAKQPLPNLGETVAEGLQILERTAGEIDLLVTHSPFGDEHLHPHHQQAFNELLIWTKKHNIPLSFFSTVPLPNCRKRSLLRNFPRQGPLHVTYLARCSYGLGDWLKSCLFSGQGWMPAYYVQWQTDIGVKRAMLDCYQSIGLSEHADGYAMFTSSVESMYFMERKGFNVIARLVEGMAVPGAMDLFGRPLRLRLLASRLLRKIKHALYS
jgi:LmbE family N-acetylglucosaminyl deacetylase